MRNLLYKVSFVFVGLIALGVIVIFPIYLVTYLLGYTR